MEIVNSFIDKIIPIKYQRVIYIGILFFLIGSYITNWIYKRKSIDNEVKIELQKFNENCNITNNRLTKIEYHIDSIENVIFAINLKLSEVTTINANNTINFYNSIAKGFEITKQEMVKAHPNKSVYINTRYDDYFTYLNILFPIKSN